MSVSDDYNGWDDDYEEVEICDWCGHPLQRRKDNGECSRCWAEAHEE